MQAPADGAIGGYKWTLLEASPNRWSLAADPIPGVTGSETGFLDVGFQDGRPFTHIQFVPTPGSDEQRMKMLGNALNDGAAAFAHLASLVSSTDQGTLFPMVLGEISQPGTAQMAFDVFAVQGNITFVGIGNALTDPTNKALGDGSVRTAVKAMWTSLMCDFQLGALHEDWPSLPGINSVPAVQSPQLFSFQGLSALTGLHVFNDQLLHTLQLDLSLAEMAAARGDQKETQKFLDFYLAGITDGTSNTFMAAGHGPRSAPAINPAAAFTLSSVAMTLMPH